MVSVRIFGIVTFFIVGNFSYGSGLEPCSKYVSADKNFFLLKEAYAASDLVVVGTVLYSTKTTLKIKNKIKGVEETNEIELTPVKCQGTACSGGFSVAQKKEMLFLLKKKDGVYDSVSGNGNFSCPVVYELEKDFVSFKKKKVSLNELKKYLENNPDPIPIFN